MAPEPWYEAWRGLAVWSLANKHDCSYESAETALQMAMAGYYTQQITIKSITILMDNASFYIDTRPSNVI